jgi:decaprenylphospho-beta-D-ribofuranose 2-oxidase
MLNLLKEFDSKYLYTVAWIDLSGDYRGRGVVSGGRHATTGELPPNFEAKRKRTSVKRSLLLPDIFPSFIINKYTVRAFNSMWFHKKLESGIVHYRKFMHPLDSIRNWNRIYGRNGLTQYQVQIPLGQENYIEVVLQEMRRIGVASFLGVIKRFGPCREEFLSFPSEGWTHAVDIPAGHKGLDASLDFLDEKLCEVGGKIYLAKDSRVSQHHFQRMYPKLSEWKVLKKKIDPENYWQSDQGRRLNLC